MKLNICVQHNLFEPVSKMQNVYIPNERIKKLKQHRELVSKVERLCNCKIVLEGDDDMVEVRGDAFPEYSARNIIYAFRQGL